MLAIESTNMVMSGRYLHFMGHRPNIRMSRDLNCACKNNHQVNQKGSYVWMVGIHKTFSFGRLRPSERLTSNQMDSRKIISSTWRHKQPIYFSGLQWAGPTLHLKLPIIADIARTYILFESDLFLRNII